MREISHHPKVLFVYQSPSAFIVKDLRLLRRFAEVREFRYSGPWRLPALCKAVAECELVFAWFAKLHALFALAFAKVLGKRFLVVAGGDDAAWVPEISYGMKAHWHKSWCPRLVFRLADRVLAVSESTRGEVLRHFAAQAAKVRTLHHGFQSSGRLAPPYARERLVVMVSRVDEEYVGRKRLDVFVASARHLPRTRFVLVGRGDPKTVARLRAQAPPNVEFLSSLSDKALRNLFARARVFVHISRHEGFGCAMAEAMLAGCIPVVSRSGAIPEVVGGAGVYVSEFSPLGVARAIMRAMRLPPVFNVFAVERIARRFPIERRARGLREELAGCR